ncbi:hypothetical protein QL285_028074 [Trifolium repens]|nr:hypothetical protein QL285_028074 [Trifolium repens]
MKPSWYDVKIQFNFITDLVHFISLVAKLLHRATIYLIVLRCKIFFFCFLGQQAASIVARWETSCYDGMLNFFTFWASARHRAAMSSSQCDVKIQFNFITDPVHFISLGAKLCHRAVICFIVL